jgi:hypothetical protein
MMSHYQYSYERVKDDSSVLNASVVQKVTNNTSSSPKEQYLKDELSLNNFERGESERQNQHQGKPPRAHLMRRVTDFIRIENHEMQIVYDNVTDQHGLFKPSFILFSARPSQSMSAKNLPPIQQSKKYMLN